MTSPLPTLPASRVARSVTGAGLLVLLAGLYVCLPMLHVVVGGSARGPGGGEFLIAMLAGLPLLLIGTVALVIAALRPRWRSRVALVGAWAGVVALGGCVVALA